jgi:ATPase subunit of ABC transporter with duplicated ATPase domains
MSKNDCFKEVPLSLQMSTLQPPPYVRLYGRAKSKLKDLHLRSLTLSSGSRVLLTDVPTFKLNYPRKYGFIGKNGSGKSLLLRKIAQKDPSLGSISPDLEIIYVDQEVPESDTTPLQLLLESDLERTWLVQEEQRLLDLEAEMSLDPSKESEVPWTLEDIYDRLHDKASDESRARKILVGLGFDGAALTTQPIRSLSGGWRMRLALAKGLFHSPDILILDEPNNHLDLAGLVWLQHYLADEFDRTLVVVSHDVDFLDSFIDELIIIQDRQLIQFGGNYAAWRRHNALPTTRPRANSAKSKTVEASVIKCLEVTFGYSADKPILEHLDFGISRSDRLAILGSNGSGKSTLLNLISGSLEPTRGEIEISRKIRLAKFHQHQIDVLDLAATVVAYFGTKYNLNEAISRKHVAKYGLVGVTPTQKIGTLSGGEKARVAIAELALQNPDIILLDEPANHLDIEGIQGLIESLQRYDGGIILVSHNQYLVNQLCDRIWVVQNKQVVPFEGTLREYIRSMS